MCGGFNRCWPWVQEQTDDDDDDDGHHGAPARHHSKPSAGPAHSKMVRFGLQNAALRKIESATAAQEDPCSNLVRTVFGPWMSHAIASGTRFSQIPYLVLPTKTVSFHL